MTDATATCRPIPALGLAGIDASSICIRDIGRDIGTALPAFADDRPAIMADQTGTMPGRRGHIAREESEERKCSNNESADESMRGIR